MHLTNPSGTKKITLAKREKLDIFLEDFKAGSREFKLEIELQGDHAECHVQGRAQSAKKDKKIWIIRQRFLGQDQIGHISLRGTAEDESFLQFDGSAVLERESINADAQVRERVILFDNAKGKLLPVLTVKTDKVKSASHGASIAPMDEENILYLQSRGIAKKEGKKLLKAGFLK